LALKWDNIDLESGMLQMRRTLVNTKGGPVLAAPKTRSSPRSVKLAGSATTVFVRYENVLKLLGCLGYCLK
jgi:hypothetical protein